MIISNLNHLEVVTKDLSIVGGGGYNLIPNYGFSGSDTLTLSHIVNVCQDNSSTATAHAYKGCATATSTAVNSLYIYQ